MAALKLTSMLSLVLLLLFVFPSGIFTRPSSPIIGRPSGRVDSGGLATFRCWARGFCSDDITITWTKNSSQLHARRSKTWKGPLNTYGVMSTVEVLLMEEDLHSRLTCYIRHSSLERPLQHSVNLKKVLRVAPQVSVETSRSSPIPLNTSVRLTCKVDRFYPNDIKVSWWRSDYRAFTQKADCGHRNPDGTFSLHLPLSTREARQSKTHYICQVIHNSQRVVHVKTTLTFAMKPEENRNACSIEPGPFLLSSPYVWIGLVLVKIGIAFLFMCLLWREAKSTDTRK